MTRPSRDQSRSLDLELEALPPQLRWREWMVRVEAVIFASPEPVMRSVLARVVGAGCNLDLLLEDIANELTARPYEIVTVAGGWQFRTRPCHAEVLRAAVGGSVAGVDLTQGDMLVLAAIAYHQPVTQAALSDTIGREVPRDTIGHLRRLDLIASGPRLPQPARPIVGITRRGAGRLTD